MSLTAVAFVLAFLAACVLAFARHPIFGLVAYVAVFYLHPPSRWWGQGWLLDIRWSLIAAAVTFLALVLRRRTRPATARFRTQKVVIVLGLLIAWMIIQSLWAVDQEAHSELITYYLKFLVAMYLIYECVDSEQHLRAFLWAHVLGCFYFAWIAYTTHEGGRFDSFGGPGVGDANGGALALVTGTLVGAALFLEGRAKTKAMLLAILPFLVNGLVATISRSGFLAFTAGGLVFNLATPRRLRLRVWLVSALGLVLFAMLTNPAYWARIGTLKHKGTEVEDVDTGIDRVEIIRAQWRMVRAHPAGCGHACTAALSPLYISTQYLSADRQRASHNTFMSMLVDHSAPGVMAYVLMILWTLRSSWVLERRFRGTQGLVPFVVPAMAGSLLAFIVADLFLPNVRYEIRLWFMTIVMLLLQWKPRHDDVAAPR